MGETEQVSNCCRAKMTVAGDSFGEGTNHYECTNCHQPCDSEIAMFDSLSADMMSDNKPTDEN